MLWMPKPKWTPLRESSSMTMASRAKVPPPPPYSSGTSGSSNPILPALIQASASGIIIGHRLITVGDEHALLPEEASAFARSAVPVRRASGAARIVARSLLHRLGHEMTALPKSVGGAPIWPKGIRGSLAHDSRVAVAAVGTTEKLEGVGIDVEPAE